MLNVPVALTEALSNAILRGNGEDPAKHVHVRAEVDTRAPGRRSAVTKAPASISTASPIDPTTPENLEREDGRGLFLMRKLMDRVERARVPTRGQRRATDAAIANERAGEVLAAFHDATGAKQPCGCRRRPRARCADAAYARRRTRRRRRAFPPAADGAGARHATERRASSSRRAGPAPRVARARTVSDRADVELEQLSGVPAPGRRRSICSPRSRSSTPPTSSPSDTRRSISSTRSARSSAAPSRSRKRRRRSSTKSPRPSARVARRCSCTTARRTRCAPSPRSASSSARVPPIARRRRCSVSAHVFRTQHPIARRRRTRCCATQEASYRRGAMLSVPIMWTAPRRAAPSRWAS